MNLLQDKWISVQRKNGEIEKITPYQITDKINENPIIEILTPRPDFKGALYQFLIGLFQTVYSPKDENEWEDRFNEPPTPEELKKETDKVAFAFDLFGEKIRFMQDITIKEENELDLKWLLLDCNEDYFNKRDNVKNVCRICAATALLTAQINSPAGGRGHKTSIRGGGPLTTLVKLEENNQTKNLWRNVYLNILPGKSNLDKIEYTFLWIDSANLISILSSKSQITSSKFESVHCYWAMPRRIFLVDSKINEEFQCDICGENNNFNISKFTSKNQGCNYDKTWTHNLSPYKQDDKGNLSAFLCKNDSILYNHWLSFVSSTKLTRPARVIKYFFENRDIDSEQAIINSFGYYVRPGQAKTICWYESQIPIFSIEPEDMKKYEAIISSILQAATKVANNLQTKVKDAWFNERQKPKGDFDFLKISFFKGTEAKFFALAKQIRDQLKKEISFDDIAKKGWLEYLNEESLKIFDIYVESGSIEYENIQRIVDARSSLISWNLGDKLKKEIGLTVLEKTTEKNKSTKQGAKKK